MKNRTIINFFIDEHRKDRFDPMLKSTKVISHDDSGDEYRLVFIFFHPDDEEALVELIQNFSSDTRFFIWFHLVSSNKPASDNFHRGVMWYKNLKRRFKQLKPFFVTRAVAQHQNIPDLKGEKFYVVNYADIDSTIKNYIFENGAPPYNKDILEKSMVVNSKKNTSDLVIQPDLNGDPHFIWLLDKLINRHELKGIIKKVTKQVDSKVYYEALVPGYSGAQVILIRYDLNEAGHAARNMIIKIDRNDRNLEREIIIRSELIGRAVNAQRMKFIFTENGEVNSYGDWGYIIFEVAQSIKPLRKFIRNKTTNSLRRIYKNVWHEFADFYHKLGELSLCESTNVWQKKLPAEAEGPYRGLVLSEDNQLSIITQLEILANTYGKISALGRTHDHLIAFLQKNDIDNASLKGWLNCIPVMRVHGDFHTSNILMDKGAKNPQFIDFALTPERPDKHAFLDLAKLSVDTELQAIDDTHFCLNDKAADHHTQWLKMHQQWLKARINIDDMKYQCEKLDGETSRNAFVTQLNKAYQLNSLMMGFAFEFYNKTLASGLPLKNHASFAKASKQAVLEDFKKQFLLTRLQFLLKTIAYSNILAEKRVFAALASWDIVRYLKIQ